MCSQQADCVFIHHLVSAGRREDVSTVGSFKSSLHRLPLKTFPGDMSSKISRTFAQIL